MKKNILSKAVCAILAFSLFLGLFGCQNGQAKLTISVALNDTVTTLDPVKAAGGGSESYVLHLFSGLYAVGGNGQLEEALCSETSVSEDGLYYTFKLRDAKWSDGSDITAEDFVYSWRRALTPGSGLPSSQTEGLFYISGAKDVYEGTLPPEKLAVYSEGENILKVELERPCPSFEDYTATLPFLPVKFDDVMSDANFGDPAKGQSLRFCGAFIVEDYGRDTLTLKKNPLYFNESSVSVAMLTMYFESDNNKAHMFFEETLDFAAFSGASKDPVISEDGRFISRDATITYAYMFNNGKSYGDKLRKAVALTIDRSYITKYVCNFDATPAAEMVTNHLPGIKEGDGFYAKYTPPYNPLFTGSPGAENEARALIAGESLPDSLRLILPEGDEIQAKIADTVRLSLLEGLGITLEIRILPQKEFERAISNGDFDLLPLTLKTGILDPTLLFDDFITGVPENLGGFSNSAYDSQIVIAEASSDYTKRVEALNAAEALLVGGSFLLCPIYHLRYGYLVNPALSNIVYLPDGAVNFNYVSGGR